MKTEVTDTLTLFSPRMPHTSISASDPPYSVAIQSFERSEAARFPDSELSVFSHVLEHEVSLYERRGSLAGPVTIRIGDQIVVDLAAQKSPSPLPVWVEEDGLQFATCDAKGVLLVESDRVYRALFDNQSWHETGLLLATGCGLPRAPLRRILHRLERQFALPVYVLSDNDTWGYFLHSLLRRGALSPSVRVPYLAVENLRYIGLRATSNCLVRNDKLFQRDWKQHWDARLRCLRQYECFSSTTWQAEFDAFASQKYARSLDVALDVLGTQCLVEIVNNAQDAGRWIE